MGGRADCGGFGAVGVWLSVLGTDVLSGWVFVISGWGVVSTDFELKRTKIIVQSAQPVKTGGAIGTNKNHACALLFWLCCLLFA